MKEKLESEIPVRDQNLLNALRASGLRVTRPRRLILQVLEQGLDHPYAQEIHDRIVRQKVRGAASVSLSTVYRTMKALEQQGVVQKHGFEGGASRFERANKSHHDHLIDVETGEVIEFSSPKIEALQEEIARERGYIIVDHKFEIYVKKKAGN